MLPAASHAEILGVSEGRVECVPRAYLEVDGKFHELLAMYIVDEIAEPGCQ